MVICTYCLIQSEPLAVDDLPPPYVATISDGIITTNNDLNNQPIQAGICHVYLTKCYKYKP